MKLKAKITGMKVPYIIRPGLKFIYLPYGNVEYIVDYINNEGEIVMSNGGKWVDRSEFHKDYNKGDITIID